MNNINNGTNVSSTLSPTNYISVKHTPPNNIISNNSKQQCNAPIKKKQRISRISSDTLNIRKKLLFTNDPLHLSSSSSIVDNNSKQKKSKVVPIHKKKNIYKPSSTNKKSTRYNLLNKIAATPKEYLQNVYNICSEEDTSNLSDTDTFDSNTNNDTTNNKSSIITTLYDLYKYIQMYGVTKNDLCWIHPILLSTNTDIPDTVIRSLRPSRPKLSEQDAKKIEQFQLKRAIDRSLRES